MRQEGRKKELRVGGGGEKEGYLGDCVFTSGSDRNYSIVLCPGRFER